MSISSYIRQIGRGVKGSSDLCLEDAQLLFSQVLNQQVSPLELGAFCIAMRMKGESVEELLGFMQAIKMHLSRLDNTGHRTIVLPSYNGSRKQINLTPMLAYALKELGFLVIVQGVEHFDQRVTTFEIFDALGWPILQHYEQWGQCLKAQLPIFVPLQTIHPGLHEVLQIREQLGLRNSGHVLAKLLNPCVDSAWQISNYTHPEYPQLLETFFQQEQANVVMMRGNEGEPTCSFVRLPEMHFIHQGLPSFTSAEIRFETGLAPVFENPNIEAHCQYLQDIIDQKRELFPGIQAQAELINSHCR